MQQTIQNPEFHTLILILIFLLGMAISSRKRQDRQFFPTSVTQELKGFAILTIIFGHIGYFLDTNDTFLFPLSVASGVGVNIFLFLSGFGLTMSTLKKQLSLLQFYKRRLLRLFLPMWIVLAPSPPPNGSGQLSNDLVQSRFRIG